MQWGAGHTWKARVPAPALSFTCSAALGKSHPLSEPLFLAWNYISEILASSDR